MTTSRFVLGRGLQMAGLLVVGKTLYDGLIVGNMAMGPELLGAMLGFGVFYVGHYILTLGVD